MKSKMATENKIILAIDCGSTTSKARFFKMVGDEYRFVAAGEAPTTVEAPYEDVTLGVCNAVREVEELTRHKLLGPEGIIIPSNGENEGVDIYVTTSSAGGGLQMAVVGLTMNKTARSAEEAALGAGAIVMDVFAVDDGRGPWDKIERIRSLRPDIILLTGGTDGGGTTEVVQMAKFLRAADPKHRLGAMYTLPIVYAGNKELIGNIKEILGDKFALKLVDNIRQVLEVKNLIPARDAIHEQFMEHVMSHAPGYDKLMKWTSAPIMPTPAGEGVMFKIFAEVHDANLIGVGLGGATTNIYSIYDGKFVRSVSSNLGMSYSICNVLKEAGLDNIMRWIPFQIGDEELIDILSNKMIRPTTVPQTLDKLLIEHAVAREALRMGFQHHKLIARPLSPPFETYIDLLSVDWLGGTGGLLSHAPRRIQSALILIDGFQVEGVTRLFQDSVFIMPHLGVLSTVHRRAALEIFEKDCLVRLGTCIAFKGVLREEDYGKKVGIITLTMPNGETIIEEPRYGTIKRIPLKEEEVAQIDIRPERGFQIALREGVLEKLSPKFTSKVHGGAAGIIIDARGRPVLLPEDDEVRRKKLLEWFTALDAYPEVWLEKMR